MSVAHGKSPVKYGLYSCCGMVVEFIRRLPKVLAGGEVINSLSGLSWGTRYARSLLITSGHLYGG